MNTVLEKFATNVTKRSMSGKRIFGYVHPPITGKKKYSGNVRTDSRAFHQNLLCADFSHWLHVSKHLILTFLFPALSLVVACSPVLAKILIFTIVSQWFPPITCMVVFCTFIYFQLSMFVTVFMAFRTCRLFNVFFAFFTSFFVSLRL